MRQYQYSRPDPYDFLDSFVTAKLLLPLAIFRLGFQHYLVAQLLLSHLGTCESRQRN